MSDDDSNKHRDAGKDDILAEGREAFEMCASADKHNRLAGAESLRFARLGEQWPDDIAKARKAAGKPMLTINKLPSFIRQVVNDARQNKPQIKTSPVDSFADPETAKIIDGIIRHIEYQSNADIAYDTGIECAVSAGVGYWRVVLGYAYEDSFDLDILIKRIRNPFSVFRDPFSEAGDSSDWNMSFVVDRYPGAEFKRRWPKATKTDFDDDSAWAGVSTADWSWCNDEGVLVAEWYKREEFEKKVVRFQNGMIVPVEYMDRPEVQMQLAAGMLQVNGEKTVPSHKVTQRLMTGLEILETEVWPGCYIPIIPVFGDEFDVEGKQYTQSLTQHSMDAQRMFNYWRSTSTELVALAPRTPWIGPKGSFASDQKNWQTANVANHAFLEYDDKGTPPQRQPLDTGAAAGALQEALNASDDMKAILGLFDASLGARSNETSGRAIIARQREGDVATFHFQDNHARAIRHTGRVVLDVMPKVYDKERVVRILGEDGTQQSAKINGQTPQLDKNGEPVRDANGEPLMRVYDLTVGKYDVVVKTGPSFTTRREEAAMQMTEMARAFPASVPVLGKHLARNLDWPGADEIAEELEQLSKNQIPDEVKQRIEEGKKKLEQLSQENAQLKSDHQAEMQRIAFEQKAKARELDLDNAHEVEKLNMQAAFERERLAMEERLAQDRMAMEERLAVFKVQLDADLAQLKATLQADATVESAKIKAENAPPPQRKGA